MGPGWLLVNLNLKHNLTSESKRGWRIQYLGPNQRKPFRTRIGLCINFKILFLVMNVYAFNFSVCQWTMLRFDPKFLGKFRHILAGKQQRSDALCPNFYPCNLLKIVVLR